MRSLKISLWFIAIICTLSIGFVVAEDDEITLSKFGSKAGPTIKFLYW